MTIIQGEDGLKCVELRYESLRKLQDELGPYLAGEGFFLKGETDLAPSDVLRFRIMLPGDFVLVEGVGVVIWTRGEEESTGKTLPGTALGFATLSEQGRELIERMVQTHQEQGGQPFDLTRPSSDLQPQRPPAAVRHRPKPKFEFQVREEPSSAPDQQAPAESNSDQNPPSPDEMPERGTPPSVASPPPLGLEAKAEQLFEAEQPVSIGIDHQPLPEEGKPAVGKVPAAEGDEVELLPSIDEEYEDDAPLPDASPDDRSAEMSAGQNNTDLEEEVEELESVPEDVPPVEPIESEGLNETPREQDSASSWPPSSSFQEAMEVSLPGEEDKDPTFSEQRASQVNSGVQGDVVILENEDDDDSTLRVPSSPHLDFIVDDDGNIEVSKARQSGSHSFWKILAAAVIFVALGGGGWWLWQHFGDSLMAGFKGATPPKTVEQSKPTPETVTKEKPNPAENPESINEVQPESPESQVASESNEEVEASKPESTTPQGSTLGESAPNQEVSDSTGGPATEILDVAWKPDPEGTRVRIRANGRLARRQLGGGILNDPPRYLLRINGIDSPFRPLEITADSPELLRIRFGYHAETSPPSLWVVFDLKDPSVKMLSRQAEGAGIEILLGRR